MVHVAVLGHGVVGSGVVEVLEKNRESIRRKVGEEIAVKRILDIREFPDLPYADRFTKSFDDIVGDPDIKVVAEVMGGLNPAFDFVSACLRAGKSVVSSNKELVAAKGAELLAIAAEKNVNFLFEASVGGGIPIIRPLHQSLAADEIDEIAGILNGTTNFILTKMIREGVSFADALAEAQRLGYAEANPAADVEGHDTCRKICILASIAFGRHVYPEAVHTEGITAVTLEDVQYAESQGRVIKLIGQTRRLPDGKCFVLVGPALIPHSSQLGGVDDVFNGIMVRGDVTGDVMFYGRGAGKLPTASAVVGDIIDCVKAEGTIPSLHWTDTGENTVADWRAQPATLYVRCRGAEVTRAVKSAFGAVQELARAGKPDDEMAFLTPELPYEQLERKLSALEAHDIELLGKIRVLEY